MVGIGSQMVRGPFAKGKMNERKNKALMGADSECKMEDGG
jgi:hypothetical protein